MPVKEEDGGVGSEKDEGGARVGDGARSTIKAGVVGAEAAWEEVVTAAEAGRVLGAAAAVHVVVTTVDVEEEQELQDEDAGSSDDDADECAWRRCSSWCCWSWYCSSWFCCRKLSRYSWCCLWKSRNAAADGVSGGLPAVAVVVAAIAAVLGTAVDAVVESADCGLGSCRCWKRRILAVLVDMAEGVVMAGVIVGVAVRVGAG